MDERLIKMTLSNLTLARAKMVLHFRPCSRSTTFNITLPCRQNLSQPLILPLTFCFDDIVLHHENAVVVGRVGRIRGAIVGTREKIRSGVLGLWWCGSSALSRRAGEP